MLKNNDLAKQFELVVKQEIINHNREISATNLSINSLNEKLDQEKSLTERDRAFFKSKIDTLQSKLDELSNVTGNLIAKFNSITRDLSVKIEDIHSLHAMLTNTCSEVRKELQKQVEQSRTQTLTLNYLENKVSDFPNLVVPLEERIIRKLHNHIDNVKQEILSRPSEAHKIKCELEQKMDVDRVDFAGMTKELLLVKKQSFIQEKKIENLYTLIDRLKSISGGK